MAPEGTAERSAVQELLCTPHKDVSEIFRGIKVPLYGYRSVNKFNRRRGKVRNRLLALFGRQLCLIDKKSGKVPRAMALGNVRIIRVHNASSRVIFIPLENSGDVPVHVELLNTPNDRPEGGVEGFLKRLCDVCRSLGIPEPELVSADSPEDLLHGVSMDFPSNYLPVDKRKAPRAASSPPRTPPRPPSPPASPSTGGTPLISTTHQAPSQHSAPVAEEVSEEGVREGDQTCLVRRAYPTEPLGLKVERGSLELVGVGSGTPSESCKEFVGCKVARVDGMAVRSEKDVDEISQGCTAVAITFRRPPLQPTDYATPGMVMKPSRRRVLSKATSFEDAISMGCSRAMLDSAKKLAKSRP
eukprot:Sspe_Gene.90283::Locus_61868_Transcript_1_1_Confidence_1.000_Length_1302::g.90283::m.90283